MHLSVDFLFDPGRSSWKLLNLEPFEGLKIQNFFISVEVLDFDFTPKSSSAVTVAEELVFW